MNSVQKQYFREIKDLLPCSARQRRRCVMKLEDTVSSFLERDPNATLEDLHEAFGSPESIAEAFLERLSPEEFSKRLSAKWNIAISIIAIVALLAIVLSVVSIVFANDIHNYHNGYFVDTRSELPSNFSISPVETY